MNRRPTHPSWGELRRLVSFAVLVAIVNITTILPGRVASAAQPSDYDLAVAIDATPDPAPAGGLLLITVTATNLGPSPATGVTIETLAPEGTAFEEASSTRGAVTGPGAGTSGPVTCVVDGDVVPDEVIEVTVVVRVTAEPGSELLAKARVVGPNDSDFDLDPFNNDAEVPLFVEIPTEMADLSVEIEPMGAEAGSGSLFTYRVTYANAADSPDAADDVFVIVGVPDGSAFASVESSSPDVDCTAPEVGESGLIVCELISLDPGASETIDVTIDVTAPMGSRLLLDACVSSAAEETDETNNEASTVVPVVASDEVVLDWEEPEAGGATTFPPPRNLVLIDDEAGKAHHAATEVAALPKQSGPTGYRVYRSTTPGVTPSPANLFTTVPASQTSATVPAAPAGTFFVVTATYTGGESAPSNEASGNVPTATVTRVSVKATKIVAIGSGFSETVTVLVDGIPFGTAAKVKRSGSKVIQKGALLNGQTIGQYLAAHPSVVIGFRNSNGGVATFRHG